MISVFRGNWKIMWLIFVLPSSFLACACLARPYTVLCKSVRVKLCLRSLQWLRAALLRGRGVENKFDVIFIHFKQILCCWPLCWPVFWILFLNSIQGKVWGLGYPVVLTGVRCPCREYLLSSGIASFALQVGFGIERAYLVGTFLLHMARASGVEFGKENYCWLLAFSLSPHAGRTDGCPWTVWLASEIGLSFGFLWDPSSSKPRRAWMDNIFDVMSGCFYLIVLVASTTTLLQIGFFWWSWFCCGLILEFYHVFCEVPTN